MTPLVVEHAVKRFRQGERSVSALDDISFEVRHGEFTAVMGASGSGKSTLLHLMAGLTLPDSGKIIINGVDVSTMQDRELTLFRRRNIGLVFQAFNLIPTLTAEENIRLPLMLERNGQAADPSIVEQRVGLLMDQLGIAGRRTHRPDALSGGEQQRVAIGRALVADPAVILADEPTGNLDSVNSQSVCELLRDLAEKQGRTIVMVTHEPSVAVYARRAVVLRDGKLIDDFPTSQMAVRLARAMPLSDSRTGADNSMICPSCGASLCDGALFCHQCGVRIHQPAAVRG